MKFIENALTAYREGKFERERLRKLPALEMLTMMEWGLGRTEPENSATLRLVEETQTRPYLPKGILETLFYQIGYCPI
jgi:hypothetical protein